MLEWSPRTALPLGLVIGLALGAGGGWLVWGREHAALVGRVAALEASEGAVQGERERLHRELSDIVRERREMANTAEQLRTQVEQQLRRLETLAQDLAPPVEDDKEPGAAPAP